MREIRLKADNGVTISATLNSISKIQSIQVEFTGEYNTEELKSAIMQRLSIKSMDYLLDNMGIIFSVLEKGKKTGFVSPLLIRYMRDKKQALLDRNKPKLPSYEEGKEITLPELKLIAKAQGLESAKVSLNTTYPELLNLEFNQGEYEEPIKFCRALNLWFIEDVGVLYVYPYVGQTPKRRINL